MIAPTTRISPSDDVFTREFDGELVLLDLASGVYYGLDGVASDAWRELCERHKTVGETVASMIAAYEVSEATLLADIAALADEWVTKGLVRVSS